MGWGERIGRERKERVIREEGRGHGTSQPCRGAREREKGEGERWWCGMRRRRGRGERVEWEERESTMGLGGR
jgi:hypothetical protein